MAACRVSALVLAGALAVVACGSPTPPTSSAPPQVPGSPAPTPPSATPPPGAFVAPAIAWPLPDLDPGLALRGPRPTLDQLALFISGNRPLLSVAADAALTDWRLARPAMSAVSGYADAMSVLPGGSLGIHLAGRDRVARIDIFRLGRGDASHVFEVAGVPVSPMIVPPRDPSSGLDAMGWPTSYRLVVPPSWRSGLYLAKLTAVDGQSYVPFIVRPFRPAALTVVLPMMTDQAYNSWDGVSLYHWEGSRHATTRGHAVSFDRPFGTANGVGLLFRTAFPLIVWLEDHGYEPGYVADSDIAANPAYATGARTLVIAGHMEYWTESMRAAFLAAEARGVGVAAFGANLAYWQARLEANGAGAPGRVLVCYKSARLDPLAAIDPQRATIKFATLPVPEPAHQLFGADWAGITDVQSLALGPGIIEFAPDVGLQPGQELPALLGGEIDQLADARHGLALARTPIINSAGAAVAPTASLWISPTGAHVFDAGTFTWTWGLDPRYAAALPGFPAEAFAHLTAEILAWVGATP